MILPFIIEFPVTNSDIDELGHVNNVVFVRYVQEVAAAHWAHVASPEVRSKYLWVVLRHEIDYKNEAFAGDLISGTTWVGEANGARFERFVKLTRKSDEKILAEAKTMWCLLDAKTRRPLRIPQEILSIL